MTSQLYLVHHGIKGQRWGVRRFQNTDGSLTSAGKKRYADTTDAKESNQKFDLTDRQKKILKTGAIVAGVALAAYGAYHFSTVSKVDARVTEHLIKDLGKEHAVFTDPRVDLTSLPKEEFVAKNLPESKRLPKNKQLVKRLVRDQKMTDIKNAKALMKYGVQKVQQLLGDKYVFMFGDTGPARYKSESERDWFVTHIKIDHR